MDRRWAAGGTLVVSALLVTGCEAPFDPDAPWFVVTFELQQGHSYQAEFGSVADPDFLRFSDVGRGVPFDDFFTPFPPGTYQLSGTYTGGALRISFGSRNGGAGAEAGSISSLEGPGAVVSSCSVEYADVGSGPETFRLELEVSPHGSHTCD